MARTQEGVNKFVPPGAFLGGKFAKCKGCGRVPCEDTKCPYFKVKLDNEETKWTITSSEGC
jgi:hypothetical protein